jgi:hypothetical protein
MSCALAMLWSAPAVAQSGAKPGGAAGSGSGAGVGQGSGSAAGATKVEEPQPNARFVRTLTNVQIELTLTDQVGASAPEKKTVSMIVSSGSWGRIRSAGSVMMPGDAPYVVDLNVDARPFVSVEGPIQLELTLVYSAPKGAADPKEPKQRPTGINQSQTVVLQSGKPMQVSQAADPISDRKVIVEVKATVLK